MPRRAPCSPGDEGRRYRLNPGEGFAEAHRVLNETKAGAASFVWPVVDGTFFPDATALARIEADVVSPWTKPSARAYAGRFRPRDRSWRIRFATPLDGELVARIRLAPGSTHAVALLETGGRRVLARGLWSGAAEQTVRFVVCGQRSLVLRITRDGAPDRFAVSVACP